jgi:hypothetical protein
MNEMKIILYFNKALRWQLSNIIAGIKIIGEYITWVIIQLQALCKNIWRAKNTAKAHPFHRS